MARATNQLKVGEMAPDFTLPSTQGPITLSQYRGKRNVVLAFYPAAFTPVWSVQMPSYEEDHSEFERYDAQVLGISVDNVPSNKAWAQSLGGLSYPLLSDFWPHGFVSVKYNALRSEGFAERALYIIDKQGIIRYIDIHDINDQPKNSELFEALKRI